MTEMIIEFAGQILGELALALVGFLGAWVLTKMAKHKELTNIAVATSEATHAAQETVLALQQKVVEGMKAAHTDGKLTEQEIQQLGIMLLNTAMKKLSDPAKDILTAAGKDITAIIQDAAEAMILNMKNE